MNTKLLRILGALGFGTNLPELPFGLRGKACKHGRTARCRANSVARGRRRRNMARESNRVRRRLERGMKR